jgi:hypothetical protein
MNILAGAATFGLVPVPMIPYPYVYNSNTEYRSTRVDGNLCSHVFEVGRGDYLAETAPGADNADSAKLSERRVV